MASGPWPPASLFPALTAIKWASRSRAEWSPFSPAGLLFKHGGYIFLLLIKPFFQFCLVCAQVTELYFKLLFDYSHVIVHLVLYGIYINYEVSSYFAHVRLPHICPPSLHLVQQLFIVIVF